MSAINTVQYCDDYPWAIGTNGTGTNYLVNNVAGYAIGSTVIAADGGSGTIIIGDKVKFAGHSTVYEVTVALSAGSFTIGTALTAAVVDNAAITIGPNWTTLSEVLSEDFEPGFEEADEADMMEGGTIQDGVTLANGSILFGSGTAPTAGTRTWFKFTPYTGTSKVVGGDLGCRVKTAKSGLRPRGGGPEYTKVTYSCSGQTAGDLIENLVA